MDQYQLFMISNREERIEKNIREMKKLRFQINGLKPKFDALMILKEEYSKLKQELEELEESYAVAKNKENLHQKSNYIQNLSEDVYEKGQKIAFANCFKDIRNKKGIKRIISSFKNYYKYQKQVYQEEYGENIALAEVIYQYYKQYKIFKKDSFSIVDTNNLVSELLTMYKTDRKGKMDKMCHLNDELDDRRTLLWAYPKKKEMLTKKLDELSKQINEIKSSDDYKLLKLKVRKFEELREMNQGFQNQIDNMKEIGEVYSFVKTKRAA